MYILECWIEHPVRSLDQTFTYLSDTEVRQGCRVLIPFAAKTLVGFSENCYYTDETVEEVSQRLGFQVKYIESVMDEDSLITQELHDLALWMRETTLSTTISCFQAMLPQKIKPVKNTKKAVRIKWVRVSEKEISLTPKQLEAYLYVQEHKEVKYQELREKYKTIAHTLVEKGALELFDQEKEADVYVSSVISSPFTLNAQQEKAMKEIENSEDPVFLLRGVTGSGKTEIYLQLAEKQLRKGKQVLILVPEISLTPQMIARVSSRFQSGLAIYHSGLNPQEKYEQYRLVKTGKARIVVGTRSAVFLPFTELGLIVVDEEHDSSYKQDNQPCYHARDIAIQRGKYHHCKVLLGSATPSLDSYARALKNVYHLVEMKERVNGTLPAITLVPMKQKMKQGQSCILSDTLKGKMESVLQQGKQVILLLNRRGFHAQLRCRTCNEVIQCPHCELAMSYHKDARKMKCHTCGTEMAVPRYCAKCGSTEGFTTLGYGTEKLEEEVRRSFPSARILRMDADTTTRKNSHEKILSSFGNHEADILLGTQMIAKGLDYPDVTLVGIINGDEGLSRSDFRSCETTFDLLMQASGRSGRGRECGEVVIQAFDPDHYAVQCAKNQDYLAFFQSEMRFRHAGQYPPYTYLISITVSGRDQAGTDRIALTMKNQIIGDFKTIGVISLLKIKDMTRDRIILKGKDLDRMRKAVNDFLKQTDLNMKGVRIDVNPMMLD